MKKSLIIIPLLGLFWSCKNQNEVLPSSKSTTLKSNKLKTFSAVDGQYELLGFGYDVTGVYGNSNSSTFQVIDVAKLNTVFPGRVVTSLNKTQNGVVSTGDQAFSYSQSLSGKLTATANVGVFGGTIKASYSDANSFNSQYIYGSYSLMIQQKSLKFNADLATLKQYLTANFLYDIQNNTPQYIVSHYGTHVLSNIILGAKLQLMYQSQTSSTDRKTAADAGLQVSVKQVFNLDAGFTYTANSTTKNFSQNLHYITYGGDPSKALIGQIAFNQSSPTINVAAWQNSSTVANAELIDIDANGLIRISDLIPDAAKAAAVSTYIDQYLTSQQVSLLPAQVYEFYNNSLNKHAYNLNPNLGSPGWYQNGTPYKAFTTSYKGDVPVYQFFNPNTNDHVLTTNSNPGWTGYRYDGIICYAYTRQVPGTVTIYEFYNVQGDHLYSQNINAVAQYPGWKYDGIPFYAFPN
jgi:hypothetical protein